jgi:hypothetical protein
MREEVLLNPFSPLVGLFFCEPAGDLLKISFRRIIDFLQQYQPEK